ncbi:MAG: hypothetical protein ACREOU_03735 [Candidatus Eiseniibacteriota bacterium]
MLAVHWRTAARTALTTGLTALALAFLAASGHADEQRVQRLGLAIYAMPTSMAMGDVNDAIDDLNEFTASQGLAPIDKITWAGLFGLEARFFATRHWVVTAGVGRISKQSLLDLQPAATTFLQVKAKVRTVPLNLGVDYYFEPKTSGDFSLRPFVGGGFMSLPETKVSLGGQFQSPDTTFGETSTSLGEGAGGYLEGGIHMMFPSRYSVIINANFRYAKTTRLYDETTGALVLNDDGTPLEADFTGFGIRFAIQANILGKPPE